jgi:hypothetical protein
MAPWGLHPDMRKETSGTIWEYIMEDFIFKV